jgi:quercetin dioxygenase-like cupin family protein
MAPGQAGPLHSFDGTQVWTMLTGSAELELDGHSEALAAGDTVVLAPGVLRQFTADQTQGFEALVTARAGVRARMPDGTDRGVPPWIA